MELSELNLKTPFAGVRVSAKNVEDESRAVDDLDRFAKNALEVGLLRGTELLVEDHNVDIHASDDAGKLLCLAGAHVCLWDWCVELLGLAGDHDTVGRLDEPLKLVQRLVHGPVASTSVNANNERSLGNRCRLDVLEPCHNALLPTTQSQACARPI